MDARRFRTDQGGDPAGDVRIVFTFMFFRLKNLSFVTYLSQIKNNMSDNERADWMRYTAMGAFRKGDPRPAASSAATLPGTYTLWNMLPKGLTGVNLFEAVCEYRLNVYANKPDEHRISDAVGVVTPRGGWTKRQRNILDVDSMRKRKAKIIDGVDLFGALCAYRSWWYSNKPKHHRVSDEVGVMSPKKGWTQRQRVIFELGSMPKLDAGVSSGAGYVARNTTIDDARVKMVGTTPMPPTEAHATASVAAGDGVAEQARKRNYKQAFSGGYGE